MTTQLRTLGHARLGGHTYTLSLDDDGACRWYHGDDDIECSGDDVEDACEQLWLREGQPSDIDWYTPVATLAQPVADDDIRRPREVQLLVAQLAAAGLELRQLRTGGQPTSSQLRRAVGIAGSYHVGLAEVRGQKQCPGGRWPHCEGQIE
jgi:hypothetical protein